MSFYVSHLCPTIESSYKQDQKCLQISIFYVFLSIIFGADVQKISTWLDDDNYEKYDVTYLA